MITEHEFKFLIEDYLKQRKRVNELSNIISGAFESPVIDYGFMLFEKLINLCFTEEGADWVFFYLYENMENCYYVDGERISLETTDDLWNLVKKHRK